MPRRPLLAAATTLSTLLLLTACNGSPEAGRPNTTPTSTTATRSPTQSPTPTGPQWTPQELTAIEAAKTQYSVARAAIDAAMAAPITATREKLEQAGNGGKWIYTVLEDLINFRDYGWYATGATKVTNVQVSTVNLKLEQPEVRLINCVDSSAIVLRFQKGGKPVPVGPGTSKRQKVSSQIVYAPSVTGGGKRWWLIAEQELGAC